MVQYMYVNLCAIKVVDVELIEMYDEFILTQNKEQRFDSTQDILYQKELPKGHI